MANEMEILDVETIQNQRIDGLCDGFSDYFQLRDDRNVVVEVFRIIIPVNGDNVVIATVQVRPTNSQCADIHSPRFHPAMHVNSGWNSIIEIFVCQKERKIAQWKVDHVRHVTAAEELFAMPFFIEPILITNL